MQNSLCTRAHMHTEFLSSQLHCSYCSFVSLCLCLGLIPLLSSGGGFMGRFCSLPLLYVLFWDYPRYTIPYLLLSLHCRCQLKKKNQIWKCTDVTISPPFHQTEIGTPRCSLQLPSNGCSPWGLPHCSCRCRSQQGLARWPVQGPAAPSMRWRCSRLSCCGPSGPLVQGQAPR